MGEGVATGDTPEPGELPAGQEESSCSRFWGLGERSPMSQGAEPPVVHRGGQHACTAACELDQSARLRHQPGAPVAVMARCHFWSLAGMSCTSSSLCSSASLPEALLLLLLLLLLPLLLAAEGLPGPRPTSARSSAMLSSSASAEHRGSAAVRRLLAASYSYPDQHRAAARQSGSEADTICHTQSQWHVLEHDSDLLIAATTKRTCCSWLGS